MLCLCKNKPGTDAPVHAVVLVDGLDELLLLLLPQDHAADRLALRGDLEVQLLGGRWW